MLTLKRFGFALCLLLAISRSSSAQTVETQEKVDAVLALKRAGAIVVSKQGSITKVSLSGIKAAGQLLDQVKILSELETLELAGTDVTDKHLEKIKRLTKLRFLNLASTKVGDKGLAHLRGLTSIRSLSLLGTQISDEGVAHLKGLKSLKEVIANDARLTAAGASALQQALPGITVIGVK